MDHFKDDRSNTTKFDDLVRLTKEWMGETGVPGVSIGILTQGEEYSTGLGITSIDHPLPVTPETLFHIGSTNKTLTATAIFMLVEQGKLNLDDPVRKYIHDFKVDDEYTSAHVTIRHLLNHSSGWRGDFEVDTGEGDNAIAEYVNQMSELPQITSLGEMFTYNNAAFVVAGRIIELIMGKSYETALREMLLEPLGMDHSYFFPHEVMLHSFSVGHLALDSQIKVYDPWMLPRGMTPCGGRLNSNIHDQLRYARFHLLPKPDGLLKLATLKLMQSPVLATDDGGWMGMNWFIKETGNLKYLEHGGSTNGQQSAFWFSPQHNFAMTVLTNENQGYVLHFKLTKWVQEHFLGAVQPEPEIMRLDEMSIKKYVGMYCSVSSNDYFEVAPDEAGFILSYHSGTANEDPEATTLPPLRCIFNSLDRFAILSEPFMGLKGDFVSGNDGRISWLRFSGRVFRRQK